MPEPAGPDLYRSIDGADAARRALQQLPNGQRVVLTLRFLAGLSEAQTADALGCAPGTVKSRCARGIATLRAAGAVGEPPVSQKGLSKWPSTTKCGPCWSPPAATPRVSRPTRLRAFGAGRGGGGGSHG